MRFLVNQQNKNILFSYNFKWVLNN
jgi:hypothetical protein